MPTPNNASVFERSTLRYLSQAAVSDQMKIAKDIWAIPPTALPADEIATSTAFLELLRNEVERVQHHQDIFAFCTLDNIRYTVRVLRDAQTCSREEVLGTLQQNFNGIDDASLQRTLELCVRLWLTVNVNSRDVTVGGTFHREQALDWTAGHSIASLLERAFTQDTTSSRMSKLDGEFGAVYLVNSCGVKLEWTDYLTDHLRLDPSRRVLLVYRHRIYLHNCVMNGVDGPIPLMVFSEALDTLNLLFPFGHPSTKQLLSKCNGKSLYALGTCGRERILDLSHFKYWRHELEALLEIYNSPPRTWKQLAVDRRNKLEWSAFWVTVMVAFLTFVSIPCSIIQAVYSVKSYHIALAQSTGSTRSEL